MEYQTLRQVLLALSFGDIERAHWIATHSLVIIQRSPWLLDWIEMRCKVDRRFKPVDFCGVTLKHPLGAAGGVDKDGIFLLALQAFNFSTVDVGTVLPRPQYGSPKPRVFAIEEDEALINRFGFNSKGGVRVDRNIERQKSRLKIPLGINVGRMKETGNEVAASDYVIAMTMLARHAAYWVWDISSPNTPGLRELQGGRYLEHFLQTLVGANKVLTGGKIPCIVKIAPDLTDEEVDEISDIIVSNAGTSGVIIGNTTLKRPGLDKWHPLAAQSGGYSGPNAFPQTFHVAERFRNRHPHFPIGFAGGVNAETIAQALTVTQVVFVNTTFGFRGPPGNKAMLEALPPEYLELPASA